MNISKYIYPKKHELKVKHQDTHDTFLKLYIHIEHGIFIYKLFDKNDKFLFFVIRFSFLTKNTPGSIFYGSFYSELHAIGRSTLFFSDFTPKTSEYYHLMVAQGVITDPLQKQAKNVP